MICNEEDPDGSSEIKRNQSVGTKMQKSFFVHIFVGSGSIYMQQTQNFTICPYTYTYVYIHFTSENVGNNFVGYFFCF